MIKMINVMWILTESKKIMTESNKTSLVLLTGLIDWLIYSLKKISDDSVDSVHKTGLVL